MTKLITIAEAADKMGVSPRTLRKWVSDGKLRAVKMPGKNGTIKFSEQYLEMWIKGRTIKEKNPAGIQA